MYENFDVCQIKKYCGHEIGRQFTVIAADVPSGGDCCTGKISEGTLKADYTVTFGFEKFGMTQYPLKEYCGQISCASDAPHP